MTHKARVEVGYLGSKLVRFGLHVVDSLVFGADLAG